MGSRTGLRLQLMREQSLSEQQQQQREMIGSKRQASASMPMPQSSGQDSDQAASFGGPTTPSNSFASGGTSSGQGRGTVTTAGGGNSSSPIIISQPIKFAGNCLVHMPPQIIQVPRSSAGAQQQQQLVSPAQPIEATSPAATNPSRRVVMSTSVPTVQSFNSMQRRQTPTKRTPPPFKSTSTELNVGKIPTSPCELSPGGYGDSPHSTSLSQSELDDINMIERILALESEQAFREANQSGPSGSQPQPADLDSSVGGSPYPPQSPSRSAVIDYLTQVSTSAPSSSGDLDALIKRELQEGKGEGGRDRRKKDIHNMIERRRRYNINDRIRELGNLLPNLNAQLSRSVVCSESKMNKGTILKASVDYIKLMQRELQRNAQQNRLHVQHIKDLESRLQTHGLAVPEPPAAHTPTPPNSHHNNDGSFPVVKTEPPDEGIAITYPSVPGDRTAGSLGDSSVGHRLHQQQYFTPPESQLGSVRGGGPQQPNGGGGASVVYSVCNGDRPAPGHAPLHSQQHQRLLPAANDDDSVQLNELMMDIAHDRPLTGNGDPLISATAGSSQSSQVSPSCVWDSATMSPDNTKMDFS